MTFKDIIEKSNIIDDYFREVSFAKADRNVFGTVLFDLEDASKISPDIIYVTTLKKLPRLFPGSNVYNFVIALEEGEKTEDLPAAMVERCNILSACDTPKQIVSKLEYVIFSERKMESSMRRITEALFSTGIKKMLSVGTEELGCPLIIIKNTGEVIAHTTEDVVSVWGEEYAVLKDDRLPDTLIKLVEDCDMTDPKFAYYASIPKARAAFVPNSKLLTVSCPICISNIEVAKIFAFTTETDNPWINADLLYRLSLISGDNIQKHSNFKVNQKQKYSNLLMMLLEGEYPNMEAIKRAAEELQLDTKGKICVAVVKIINEQNEIMYVGDMLNILSGQISSRIPGVLWLINNGELALVFNIHDGFGLPDYEYHVLEKISEANNISIGISHSFDNLVALKVLHRQANQAADLGYRFLHKKITYFKEISYYALINTAQKEDDPIVFVDPQILRMFKDGNEMTKDFLVTFYYYLKYQGNTSIVAEKMHLHRNSVLYRIDKLQQMMDIDLNDGIAHMKNMMSFEILKYLGLFNPEE